ncbi:MAG: glycosyltransferase family 2 protein [Porticoccaceae bacterium]|jgi:glycosyltransferase involved in cell wall biosynthesis
MSKNTSGENPQKAPQEERLGLKLVSVVVPFYNEEQGVDRFYASLCAHLDNFCGYHFEVVCVDDGSVDKTLKLLQKIAANDRRFRVVELSRNFGKEAALTAGIELSKGDAIIPMDADLQDPPELIGDMLQSWRDGADVVLARRTDRSVDSALKRVTAAGFYRLHNRISKLKIPENVGDFRLMDKAVVDALKTLPEQQRFLKGLFAWLGFRTVEVGYVREERAAGYTKFSVWRLWNLALEGITSFSTAPLRIWTYIGVTLASITLLYAFYTVGKTLITGIDVPGYASLLVSVLFLGSLQLIGIGVLGEYVGRIYMESKRRPPYIVRKIYELPETEEDR